MRGQLLLPAETLHSLSPNSLIVNEETSEGPNGQDEEALVRV